MRKQLLVLFIFLISLVSYTMDIKIVDIKVAGNKEIPTGVIKSHLISKIGDEYHTNNIIKDYDQLKKLTYIDDVSIKPELDNSNIRLIINIKESKDAVNLLKKDNIVPLSERVTVDKSKIVESIDISGNKQISKSKILKLIPSKVGSYFSKERVLQGVKNIMMTGNFRSVVPDAYAFGSGITIEYKVIENPLIKGVIIKGNTEYSESELKKLIKIKTGQVLNVNTLREDTQSIIEKYRSDGFTLAKIINVSMDRNMNVVIDISEGIVREVEYQKMVTKHGGTRRRPNDTQLKTANFVIQRELEIKKGKIFNKKDYDQTVRNLMRSGAFKEIKPEYKSIPEDPNGVKVILLIDEDKTAQLNGSISYGSAVGLVGSISVKETNWKGRGQHLGFTFEKSSENYTSMSLSYRDPWIKDTKFVSWGWNLFRQQDEDDQTYDHYNSTSYGGVISMGKGVSRYLRFEMGLKLEQINESNKDSQKTQDYYYTSLTPSIIYDTRNNYLDPTSGNYAKFGIEFGQYFGTTLGSKYDGDEPHSDVPSPGDRVGVTGDNDAFSKASLELRKYHRGFFKNNTMAYRMVAGIGTKTLKYQQLFAAGGANSLRGYDYGWLRGQTKIVFNIENRTKLNDTLGVVLFCDTGRSWYTGKSQDSFTSRSGVPFPDDIKVAAGVGLRIKTPVGPIRLDFGWPIGDKQQKGMQFFFNMGQMF